MKIICIGRNYGEHAKELGNDLPTEPIFFLKPDSAILPKKQPLFFPGFTQNLHYEIELVVRIDKLGKHIEERFAHKYYNEIGLGIDFTARDLQEECKTKGLPWEKAKSFDGSAVLGTKFFNKIIFNDLENIEFSLDKNGKQVQKGNSKEMIFKIDQIIAYLSTFYTLKIGDLIFTGTPSGVGPVVIGDKLEGYLNNEKLIDLSIK